MADFNKRYVSVSSGFWNRGCHCAGSQGGQGTLHNARHYHKVNTFGFISKREERPDTCGLGRALKTESWHYFKRGSQWTHLSIWGRGVGCGPVGLWDQERVGSKDLRLSLESATCLGAPDTRTLTHILLIKERDLRVEVMEMMLAAGWSYRWETGGGESSWWSPEPGHSRCDAWTSLISFSR